MARAKGDSYGEAIVEVTSGHSMSYFSVNLNKSSGLMSLYCTLSAHYSKEGLRKANCNNSLIKDATEDLSYWVERP
jgi:hypothetical protein